MRASRPSPPTPADDDSVAIARLHATPHPPLAAPHADEHPCGLRVGAGVTAAAFQSAALDDGFKALFFKSCAGDGRVVNSGDLVFKGSTCAPNHPSPAGFAVGGEERA